MNKEEKDVLNLILEDKEALDYFFIKSKNAVFLKPLYEKNFFSAIDITKQQSSNETDNNLIWKPAVYLQSIAQNLPKENKSIAIENLKKLILEIMKNFSIEIKKMDKAILSTSKYDIGYIFYVFTDITTHLHDAITDEIIDSFDLWLQYRYGIRDLFDSNIIKILSALLQDSSKNKEQIEKISLFLLNSIKIKEENYMNQNDDYYIFDFFTKAENIEKISEVCSDDFIRKIAGKLSSIVNNKEKVNIKEQDFSFLLKKNNDNSSDLEITSPENLFPVIKIPFYEFKDALKLKNFLQQQTSKITHDKKDIILDSVLSHYFYLWEDFSYIWYPSLFNDSANKYGSYNYKNIFIFIFKELIETRLHNMPATEFNQYYSEITKHYKSFIFKRMLIYCWGIDFEKHRTSLLNLLKDEKKFLFHMTAFEAEIFNALEINTTLFNDEEKKIIEDIINNGPYFDSPKDVQKKYFKKKWYFALLKDSHFKELYDSIENMPEPFLNFKDRFVAVAKELIYKSIFTDEEALNLLSTNLSELIKKINDFNEPKGVIWDEKPSPEGIASQIGKIISQTAETAKNVLNNINEFINCDSLYIRHILYGFRDNKNLDIIEWREIFDFVIKYLNQKPMSVEDRNIIISAFTYLISEKYSKEYDSDKKIIGILSGMADILLKDYAPPPKKNYADSQYINTAINTYMGNVIDSIITISKNFNLDNENKEREDIWDPALKKCYEKLLAKNIDEAYILLGFNIPTFKWLSYDWILKKIEEFSTADKKIWKLFFGGFLERKTLYPNYYKDMCSWYKRAIELAFENEIMAHNLMLFFLGDYDKLQESNSLIIFAYNEKNFELLERLTNRLSSKLHSHRKKHFINVTKDELDEEEEKKANSYLLKFWNFFCDKYRDLQIQDASSSEQKFLLALVQIISSLNEITHKDFILIESIIDRLQQLHTFVDVSASLLTIAKKSKAQNTITIDFCAKLYIKLIKNISNLSFFDKEILEQFLSLLQEKGLIEFMKSIRQEYVNKNDTSRDEVFNKFF